jgi:hypothetical protein
MKGDNNVGTLMSYAKVDNLRVLEYMIGLLRAKEKSRISESLGERIVGGTRVMAREIP